MLLIRLLFPQVRRHEHGRFLFFLSLFFLVNTAQTTGLILSEALLLASYGPASLPVSFIVAALATIAGSLLYALGVHQSKNDRYFIDLLAGLAALVGLAWWGLGHGVTGIPYVLVCLYFLSQCILTNHYWTFTGDFFDTLSAKRLFPLFVVGSSLGGMCGGLLLSLTGKLLTPTNQLLFWPIFLVAAIVLLRACRRPLRRWGPLELEEADETSLNEMRNAARYLQQSTLGRQLVWSCAFLILTGFFAQYLYSSLFLIAYPQPEALTQFLAVLLTATNFLEILVEVAVTPWLIRHLGVGNAYQVHSLLSLLGLMGVCFSPGLASAIALRCTRESLENAIAAPVRTLVYNALPARSRGRVRAFLEGMVTYAAMALAGAILWLGAADKPPAWMYALAAGSGCLYAASNWAVRRSYLKALIDEVQAGRLDLQELNGRFVGSQVQQLQSLWTQLSSDASEQPDPGLLRLAQSLGARQLWQPLMQTAEQGEKPSWLRRACLQALSSPEWTTDWRLIQQCAAEKDPQLRQAALHALLNGRPGVALPEWLLHCVDDPHPEVRALACLLVMHLAPEQASRARHQLLEMLSSPEVPVVMAALRQTPGSLIDELLQRCNHPSGRITRTALQRLAELHPGSEASRKAWLKVGLDALQRREPPVRRAALQMLNNHRYLLPDTPQSWAALTRHLEEPSKAARDLTVSLLQSYPFELGPLVRAYVDSPSGPTSRAAVQCLALSPRKESREALNQLLREEVYRLWTLTLVMERVPEGPQLRRDYVLLCLGNAVERSRKLVFELLAGLETPKVIRSVEKVLRFTNLRARADALEVLSNLGDRESARLLVALLEQGEMVDKTSQLPANLLRQAEWSEFCQLPWLSHDNWLARAVLWLNPNDPTHLEEETVERLLVLRKVPLFAQMSLEQLMAIDERLEEQEYLAGEVVFEEGQLGAELYILLEGGVKIVKSLGTNQELLLTRLEGVNYFGEMAILDDEPRSASVVVERNSRLLLLKGEQLKDLVEQMPELAFEIIKVLTHRIRAADERLAKTKA